MGRYAMVVVVKADDPDAAYEDFTAGGTDQWLYVGNPWEVRNQDGDYYTRTLIDQRKLDPEAFHRRLGLGRYIVAYGEGRWGELAHVLVDPIGRVCFESDRKSDVIRESQVRNGYEPADGSEATYGKQLEQRGLR